MDTQEGEVTFIMTRRAESLFDLLQGTTGKFFLRSDILERVRSPLTELVGSSVVVIEVPPLCQQGCEDKLLFLVKRIRQQGAHVL